MTISLSLARFVDQTLLIWFFSTSRAILSREEVWWTEGSYTGVRSLPRSIIIHETCYYAKASQRVRQRMYKGGLY